MEFVDKVMAKIDKITGVLMPPSESGEPDPAAKQTLSGASVQAQAAPKAEIIGEVKVANGESIPIYDDTPGGTEVHSSGRNARNYRRFGGFNKIERPQLTVHTTEVAHLDVQVFNPTSFDQVKQAADDIRGGRVAVVNYEQLAGSEQRRICDFLNGSCFALSATPLQVAEQIVVYVPHGIEVERIRDSLAMAMPD